MNETARRLDPSLPTEECFDNRLETAAEKRAYVLALARQQNVHPMSREEILQAPFRDEEDDIEEFLEAFRSWRAEA